MALSLVFMLSHMLRESSAARVRQKHAEVLASHALYKAELQKKAAQEKADHESFRPPPPPEVLASHALYNAELQKKAVQEKADHESFRPPPPPEVLASHALY